MVRKNGKSVYALVLLASLLLISCDNSGRSMFKARNSVAFDTIRVGARNHLDGDTANPFCDIRIEFIYPVSSQKTSVDTLQQFFVRSMFGTSYDTLRPAAAVEAYKKSYIDNYTYDASTYRESASDIRELNAMIPEIDISDSEHAAEDIFYSYFENLSDSIVYNQYGILSFQVKQSNNKGGATSYTSFRNYVFNLSRGSQVAENEIFNAGYDTALQGLIVASLLEQNNVKTVAELEDLGFFGIQEIVPNKNFLLNRDGIIYTYNKGEYSAYQLDAPEVFIPYKAIRSLLRENSIASKLADL
jgi:hypothetical protein